MSPTHPYQHPSVSESGTPRMLPRSSCYGTAGYPIITCNTCTVTARQQRAHVLINLQNAAVTARKAMLLVFCSCAGVSRSAHIRSPCLFYILRVEARFCAWKAGRGMGRLKCISTTIKIPSLMREMWTGTPSSEQATLVPSISEDCMLPELRRPVPIAESWGRMGTAALAIYTTELKSL